MSCAVPASPPFQELSKVDVISPDGGAPPTTELGDTMKRLPLRVSNTLADGAGPLSFLRRAAPFQSMTIMAAIDISK